MFSENFKYPYLTEYETSKKLIKINIQIKFFKAIQSTSVGHKLQTPERLKMSLNKSTSKPVVKLVKKMDEKSICPA